MAGKLDDISFALGEIKADIRELKNRADEDRELVNTRHGQNASLIDALRREIRDFDGRCMRCLQNQDTRSAVNAAVQKQSRSKIAALASIGFAVLALTAWVVEASVKWAVAWAWSHLH